VILLVVVDVVIHRTITCNAAYEVMIWIRLKREWLHQTISASGGNIRWQFICEPEKFREYIYELIRYEYAYMLFDKELASKDKPASAANQKYIAYGRAMPRAVKTNLQDVSVSQ